MENIQSERDKRIIGLFGKNKNLKILVIGTGVMPRSENYLLEEGFLDITSVDIDKRNVENGKKMFKKVLFKEMDAQKNLLLRIIPLMRF